MNVIPNLRKALYARCAWKNQLGQKRFSEQPPKQPTHNGEYFNPNEIVEIGDVTITRLEHATRLGGPDKWEFEVTVTFPASQTITVVGEHAEKLWKAWKAVVFGG